MSTAVEIHPEKQREPQRGDVYEDKHGSVYQLIHIDEQVALLRDKQTDDRGRHYHRTEDRIPFDQMRSAGFFEHKPDSDLDLFGEQSVDWTEADGIGAGNGSNLEEAGFETALDVVEADDDELLAVDGIGQKALNGLREFTP
jgi:hypothetical protein